MRWRWGIICYRFLWFISFFHILSFLFLLHTDGSEASRTISDWNYQFLSSFLCSNFQWQLKLIQVVLSSPLKRLKVKSPRFVSSWNVEFHDFSHSAQHFFFSLIFNCAKRDLNKILKCLREVSNKDKAIMKIEWSHEATENSNKSWHKVKHTNEYKI